MSYGPSRNPSRDASARVGAFEIEVEVTWGRLRWKPMTVCLSPRTGNLTLRWPVPPPAEFPGEIGTFTRAITLADFRQECFAAYDKDRRR